MFTLMGEGYQPGGPPSEPALLSWCDDGATFPILADPLWENVLLLWNEKIELGQMILLSPGMVVKETGWIDIESVTPE